MREVNERVAGTDGGKTPEAMMRQSLARITSQVADKEVHSHTKLTMGMAEINKVTREDNPKLLYMEMQQTQEERQLQT